MKKTKQNKKVLFVGLLIVITLTYIFTPRGVRFEDIHFNGSLPDYTSQSIPYEVYFSITNPTYEQINCTAILSLNKTGEIKETNYFVGEIPKLTKIKYKIKFDMPLGNTSINLFKECD